MSYRTVLIAALFGAASGLCSAAAVAGDAVTSYGAALEQYKAARSKAPSPLNAQDRQVMGDAAQALAREMPDPGLHPGDSAPDFVLPNARGTEMRLSSVLEQGPVVLVFYRGAWCPYCNLHLNALQQSLPAIRAHGGQLIAVTPQKPDKSLGQVEKDGFSFEILSDLDDSVMKDYRLYFEVSPELRELYKHRLSLDLAEFNGPGRYVLPVPGTFVIDRRGKIVAAFADTDYKQRMEPTDIIDALRQIETNP